MDVPRSREPAGIQGTPSGALMQARHGLTHHIVKLTSYRARVASEPHARATGFRIAPGWLATAKHLFNDHQIGHGTATTADLSKVELRTQAPDNGAGDGEAGVFVVGAADIVLVDDVDLAFIRMPARLEARLARVCGPLPPSAAEPRGVGLLVSCGAPNHDDPLISSPFPVDALRHGEGGLIHLGWPEDTAGPGASGAPVFVERDGRHTLLGLHLQTTPGQTGTRNATLLDAAEILKRVPRSPSEPRWIWVIGGLLLACAAVIVWVFAHSERRPPTPEPSAAAVVVPAPSPIAPPAQMVVPLPDPPKVSPEVFEDVQDAVVEAWLPEVSPQPPVKPPLQPITQQPECLAEPDPTMPRMRSHATVGNQGESCRDTCRIAFDLARRYCCPGGAADEFERECRCQNWTEPHVVTAYYRCKVPEAGVPVPPARPAPAVFTYDDPGNKRCSAMCPVAIGIAKGNCGDLGVDVLDCRCNELLRPMQAYVTYQCKTPPIGEPDPAPPSPVRQFVFPDPSNSRCSAMCPRASEAALRQCPTGGDVLDCRCDEDVRPMEAYVQYKCRP